MKIASCSCGKDSLAMTYKSIDEGKLEEGDEIVFFSNGMDFKCIYDLWKELKEYAESKGIKCIQLKPRNDFLYDMLIRPKTKRNGEQAYGDGWCGGNCRWGTFQKKEILDKYCKNALVYIGLAVEETKRIEKLEPNKYSPLVEWKMTEADCLEYCRNRGIKWLEWSERINDYVDLYDILDRVSCWCCRNKNQWELYNIWYYFPNTYWKQLLELQSKISSPFRQPNKDGKYGFTLFELQEKFESGYVPKRRKKIIK